MTRGHTVLGADDLIVVAGAEERSTASLMSSPANRIVLVSVHGSWDRRTPCSGGGGHCRARPRVAELTGCSRSSGRICGRDADRLDGCAGLDRSTFHRATAPEGQSSPTCPSTDGAAVRRRCSRAARWTAVDILVCNGGGPPPGRPVDHPGRLPRALESNCLASIAMCAALPPHARGAVGTDPGDHLDRGTPADRLPRCLHGRTRRRLTAYLKMLSGELAPSG